MAPIVIHTLADLDAAMPEIHQRRVLHGTASYGITISQRLCAKNEAGEHECLTVASSCTVFPTKRYVICNDAQCPWFSLNRCEVGQEVPALGAFANMLGAKETGSNNSQKETPRSIPVVRFRHLQPRFPRSSGTAHLRCLHQLRVVAKFGSVGRRGGRCGSRPRNHGDGHGCARVRGDHQEPLYETFGGPRRHARQRDGENAVASGFDEQRERSSSRPPRNAGSRSSLGKCLLAHSVAAAVRSGAFLVGTGAMYPDAEQLRDKNGLVPTNMSIYGNWNGSMSAIIPVDGHRAFVRTSVKLTGGRRVLQDSLPIIAPTSATGNAAASRANVLDGLRSMDPSWTEQALDDADDLLSLYLAHNKSSPHTFVLHTGYRGKKTLHQYRLDFLCTRSFTAPRSASTSEALDVESPKAPPSPSSSGDALLGTGAGHASEHVLRSIVNLIRENHANTTWGPGAGPEGNQPLVLMHLTSEASVAGAAHSLRGRLHANTLLHSAYAGTQADKVIALMQSFLTTHGMQQGRVYLLVFVLDPHFVRQAIGPQVVMHAPYNEPTWAQLFRGPLKERRFVGIVTEMFGYSTSLSGAGYEFLFRNKAGRGAVPSGRELGATRFGAGDKEPHMPFSGRDGRATQKQIQGQDRGHPYAGPLVQPQVRPSWWRCTRTTATARPT